jgi:predicted nucleic acid-binding OB-fold protein
MPAPPARIRSASVPCGIEFHLQLAGEILPLEFLVLADIGRDHLLHLPGAKQLADALVIDARVVAREGEAGNTALAHRVQQALGYAAKAEAATGDQQAVLQQAIQRRLGVRVKFFRHASPSTIGDGVL